MAIVLFQLCVALHRVLLAFWPSSFSLLKLSHSVSSLLVHQCWTTSVMKGVNKGSLPVYQGLLCSTHRQGLGQSRSVNGSLQRTTAYIATIKQQALNH